MLLSQASDGIKPPEPEYNKCKVIAVPIDQAVNFRNQLAERFIQTAAR